MAAQVVWAAGTQPTVETIAILKDILKANDVHVDYADLSRPRTPNDIIVIDASFPFRTVMYDYERHNTPFHVISFIPKCSIIFKMCESVYYI